MPWSRFEQVLVTANRAIIFLMMAVMATLVFTNVITRYLFNCSIVRVQVSFEGRPGSPEAPRPRASRFRDAVASGAPNGRGPSPPTARRAPEGRRRRSKAGRSSTRRQAPEGDPGRPRAGLPERLLSIPWAEEVSQYLMIWIASLGAGLAMREGRHVAIEMFQDRLPAPLGRRPRMVVGSLVLGFLGLVTVLGFRFAAFAWQQETPVLNIPLGIPYLAVPIGATLSALHLLLMFRGYVEKQYGPGSPLEDLSGEEV